MACTRPLGGYRTKDGRITFHRTPDGFKNREEVACGQCDDCRIAKAQEWAIRAMHEAQMHKKNAFITLTYEPEHMPQSWSLDQAVWRNFAHRMRKTVGPFRFIHVGEYGEQNLRPHYHALIFGQNFEDDRAIWKEDPISGRKSYRSHTLQKLWPYGFHDIQDLTTEAANYVCRYAIKKVMGSSTEATERREKKYERVDPFTGETWQAAEETWSMSLKPGIGETWLKKYRTDVFPSDHVVVDGKEKPTPRYYLKKLKEWDQKEWDEIKAKRREAAKKNAYRNGFVMRKAQAQITKARLKLRAARKLDD